MCSFFIFNDSPPSVEIAVPDSDQVVKTMEKSEREVICLPGIKGKEVFYIDRIWVVNEYQSGKIITETRQDTLQTEVLPKGKPCPGNIIEVTMR
jgi:hypothetical protein